MPDQGPTPERTIDNDGNALFVRQRQQAGFRFPISEVVCQLDEVDRLGGHDAFQIGVAAPVGRRNANVAKLPRLLQGKKKLEICLPIDQIVHLKQVEAADAPAPTGLLQLPAGVGCRRSDLVRRKHASGIAKLRESVTDGRL